MGFQSVLENHPDYVAAIGMISIENANLELMLGSLFAAMLDLQVEVGQAIYLSPKSSMARLELMSNAAQAVFAVRDIGDEFPNVKADRLAWMRKVKRIAERAKSVVGKRHAVMHDSWGIKPTGGVVRQSLPYDPEAKELGVHQPIDELHSVISQIRNLIDDVQELSREFRAKHMRDIISEEKISQVFRSRTRAKRAS